MDHLFPKKHIKSCNSREKTEEEKKKKKKGIYKCGKYNYYDRKPTQSTKCIKCSHVGDKNG
jgi:hypothetical protein